MSQPTLLERARGIAGGAPRIETDLSDAELERMIDTENQEVIQRYGPHADPDHPLELLLEGGGVTLDLLRPMDVGYPAVVTEYWRTVPFGDPTSRVLTRDTDYRVWFGGRTLERLASGTNYWDWSWAHTPSPEDRFGWGGSAGWVTIAYVPVNDGDQRAEVILQLVDLRLRYNPVSREDIGDQREFPLAYRQERERILGSLAPRKGLLLR